MKLKKLTKESKSPQIYKSKKLNNAIFKDFTLNDYRIFLHLVSKVKQLNQEKGIVQREYKLRATEFSQMFNIDIDNAYKLLFKACKKLMKESLIIEKLELGGIWETNLCSHAEYYKSQGYIVVEFTDRIMPYLLHSKGQFVLYHLKEIANLGSIYTTRLYELVQEYKTTGWFSKSVDNLREIFAVGENFKLYADFKRKTFAHACQEINEKFGIDLEFRETKEGRKVSSIKFVFDKEKLAARS